MYRLSSLAQALFLFAVSLAVSCTSPNTPSAHLPALTIAIGNHVSARTLIPNLDMIPASYTIAGTGPGGATFQASSTGGTVTQDSLAFGSWTIVVQALNAGGTLIGGGSTTVLVHSGETAMANVTVTPLTGTGALDLTVNWTASQVQTPGIVASLTPALGSAVTLPFSVSGASATSTTPNLPNGYSTLSVSLQDNGIVVMGAVEIVRIVKDQTTTGTYNFLNVNQATGSIQLNVTTDMQDPLEVSIGGASPVLVQGGAEALTASVVGETGNTVYVWYVNGVSVATGANYSFGANQKVGYYRIDVTAFSADGSRAGSATAEVAVERATIVYAATTNQDTSTGAPDLGYWKNGEWTSVATDTHYPANGYVSVDQGNVYFASEKVFRLGGFFGMPGYAINGDWTELTPPSASAWVSGLFVEGGVAYITAHYGRYAPDVGQGYWANGVWTELVLPNGQYGGDEIKSVVADSGHVYVAVNSNEEAGYWDNGTWNGLPGGNVESITVRSGVVLAAGNKGTVPGLWIGGVWSPLAVPALSPGGVAKAVAVAGEDNYVAGYIWDNSGGKSVGIWKNGIWSELPKSQIAVLDDITCLVVHAGSVYAGGVMFDSNNVFYPGYWKDGQWVALPTVEGRTYGPVTSIAVE